MAKETLTNKLARKSFESEKIQQSWRVHLDRFGPIIKDAFKDNYSAKIELCLVLNLLSRRDFNRVPDKLNKLFELCLNDEDHVACLFMTGLYYELAGDYGKMFHYYRKCNSYHHGFYMPYIRVAKFYLDSNFYQGAYDNYQSAIACYDLRDLSSLASTYANMTTCLLMMQRFEEAYAMLNKSKSIIEDLPSRLYVEVILNALMNKDYSLCLEQLKEQLPSFYPHVLTTLKDIHDHKDIRFFTREIDEQLISKFWDWFKIEEQDLDRLIEIHQLDDVFELLTKQLQMTFPFIEHPNVEFKQEEDYFVIEFVYLHAVGIRDAYTKLLEKCPDEYHDKWRFIVLGESVL